MTTPDVTILVDNFRWQPRWQLQITTLDDKPDDNRDDKLDDNSRWQPGWQLQMTTVDNNLGWQPTWQPTWQTHIKLQEKTNDDLYDNPMSSGLLSGLSFRVCHLVLSSRVVIWCCNPRLLLGVIIWGCHLGCHLGLSSGLSFRFFVKGCHLGFFYLGLSSEIIIWCCYLRSSSGLSLEIVNCGCHLMLSSGLSPGLSSRRCHQGCYLSLSSEHSWAHGLSPTS